MTEPERVAAALEQLEATVALDVGRGIGPLADAARGGLAGAARSIADHEAPHVALLTGFFVPAADPPAAETDGPVGAALLAAGLAAAGVAVRLVTDDLCSGAVRAACRAAGVAPEVPIERLPLEGRSEAARMHAAWSSAEPPVSHVVAIERVGPAAGGVARNMRGGDISAHTAPLHLLFAGASYVSVGIGDGGNELGMGALPRGLVAMHIDHGGEIACAVGCDHLLVCGVSNWGAWALLAALALLRPSWRPVLEARLDPRLARQVLERTVEEGPAVDGVLGKRECSVDGLDREVHEAVLERVRTVLREAA